MSRIELFKNEHEWLSNFYPCTVRMRGQVFPSSEHAFQAAKTLYMDERARIATLTAGQAKRAGRSVELRPDWENIKDKVMMAIVLYKFKYNPELQEKLLATKDALLVEGNWWHDNYWGNCICQGCKDKIGKNKLGRILMQVRYVLERS